MKPLTPTPPLPTIFSCFSLHLSHQHHLSEGRLETQFKALSSALDSSLEQPELFHALSSKRHFSLSGQDQEVLYDLLRRLECKALKSLGKKPKKLIDGAKWMSARFQRSSICNDIKKSRLLHWLSAFFIFECSIKLFLAKEKKETFLSYRLWAVPS